LGIRVQITVFTASAVRWWQLTPVGMCSLVEELTKATSLRLDHFSIRNCFSFHS